MYIKKIMLGMVSPILLTACGDVVDKIADSVNDDLDAIHDKINGSCVTNSEGDLWFSAKDSTFYQCTNGSWTQIQVDAAPTENASAELPVTPGPLIIEDSSVSITWVGPVSPIHISKDCDENGDKYKLTNDWSIYQCENGRWTLIHEDWQLVPFPVLSSSSVTPPVMSSSSIWFSSSSIYPSIAMEPVYLDDYMWRGDEFIYQITTDLDNGSETSGYWYTFNDNDDGGRSQITWPVELGNEYSEDALDPVIELCGGLCASYNLSKGTLSYNPFVGVGFNVAGEGEDGAPTAADASNWGGICLSYASSHPVTVEMGLTNEAEREYGWDLPVYVLPKSNVGQIKCIAWDEFKQAGWGGKNIRGEEASKQLASLRFRIQNSDRSQGTFNIMSIGKNRHVAPIYVLPEHRSFQWYGSDFEYRIETGLDAGYENSGYWYEFTDEADGGKSRIEWPVEKGNGYSDDAMDPIIDYCEGVCGTVILNKGKLDYNPYVGIGFNVAGVDDYGERISSDVTAWNGLCVEYTSEMSATLEMDLGDALNTQVGYDVPFVNLPKATVPSIRCFAWSKFVQAGWGLEKYSGSEAATQLAGFRFVFQGTNRTKAKFNIKAIYSLSPIEK